MVYIVHVGCSVSAVPFPVLYVYSCLFLALVLCLLFGAALLHQRLKRKNPHEQWVWNSPRERVYFALLLGYEVTLIQFVEMTFKLFYCRYEGADGSGRLVLAADTATECFGTGHTVALVLAIPIFLLHFLVCMTGVSISQGDHEVVRVIGGYYVKLEYPHDVCVCLSGCNMADTTADYGENVPASA